jgi:hypothetical protein
MNKKHRITIAALALMSALAFVSPASALPLLLGTDLGGGLWTASDTDGRISSATFMDISASSINAFSLTLSNLANASDSRVPNQLLVGLIFEFNVDPGLIDPSSDAFGVNVTGNVLPSGSAQFGTNLDGEFAFQTNMFGPTGGLGDHVISSSAYDPLGINPVIDPSVAYPPLSTNGADFGIAASGANPVPAITQWVDRSATIYFQTTSAFDFSQLRQVHFMYGTDFHAVPEPRTLSLLGAGLLVLAFANRRRKTA